MQNEDILNEKPPDPDSRIDYGQDPHQFVDVRIPSGKGPHPTVFFIHGGYWRAKYDLTYAGHLCHALKKAGIATWNVEYRRVGNPGGGWPGSFEDVRSAYRVLHEHPKDSPAKLDLNRLCVAGHSAGGQLALCLAAFERSVTRVLSLASPAEQHIPQATQKLIHGTADDSVPYAISQSYAERKKKSGEQVELITLPKTGHFEIVDPGSAMWAKVQETFLALTRA